jgi:hypothetical protein
MHTPSLFVGDTHTHTHTHTDTLFTHCSGINSNSQGSSYIEIDEFLLNEFTYNIKKKIERKEFI